MHGSPKIAFLGTPELAVPALRALHDAFGIGLVVTQPDKPAGRGRQPAPSPVKSAALDLGIPVHQPGTLRTDDALAPIGALAPDFLVVLAYGEILESRLLSLPKIAPINAHMSLLPRYRGPSPINAALLAGDEFTGVTTMRMVKSMDAGPVFLVEKVPIDPRDTAESLALRLAPIAARLLVDTVHGMLSGTVTEKPQAGAATYCRLIEKDDGRIDWSLSACHIERMTRAYYPWPTAWTHFTGHGGKRVLLKMLEAACCSNSSGAAPGTVIAAGCNIEVACGQGVLSIMRVQPEGKKPMRTRDFLNGYPLFPGMVLG